MPKPQPINPLRNRAPINAPTALRGTQTTGSAQSRPAKRACPNKQCTNPQVEEGICHNCGTIVDDSNIVAEVQFGETSNGAAMVQGSFVGADQGTAKSLGPAFRRAGGEEGREATVREGRRIMLTMGAQMPIPVPEHVINSGVQIFKIAAMNNFIQGRRMDMVAAVCLYSACRKETPCKVMLIDFADKCQVNVFKLGHTFKALHSAITMSKDGILPILPEDLIYRFAMKLEFGSMLDKVADDACRMVKRMSFDWMVMGRRPSGVCGACLILAARMNNFRRTITEVVYVVKVTTHTIQKRLDEFKLTSTGNLTIEEFLNNEWSNQTAHDPPSFYEKTEEFQKTRKRRKGRKFVGSLDAEIEDEDETSGEDSPSKRRKTATPSPAPQSPEPSEALRRDADGFAIPPRPNQSSNISATPTTDIPIDPELMDPPLLDPTLMNSEQEQSHFDQLVDKFGAELAKQGEEPTDESEPGSPKPKRGRRPAKPIRVSEGWEQDEQALEREISEMISDPNTEDHARSYARAAKRAAAHMLAAQTNNPQLEVNMDVHIGEDEFENDIEVANCLLTPEQVAAKERIWVNTNRDWLRKQQLKEYQKLMAERGPPKATRNRKKKPRIGEGQTSAASSLAEAAVQMMNERSLSRKIDYEALKSLFDVGGSALGSATTSRRTSRAGSVHSETPSDTSEGVRSLLKGNKPRYRPRSAVPTASMVSPPADEVDSEPDSDDDDYVDPLSSTTPLVLNQPVEEEDSEDWRDDLAKTNKPIADEDAGFDDDDVDYGFENGDVDDTAFDDTSNRGFVDEDEDEY